MDTQVEEPEFESKPFSSISKEWNMLGNGRSGVNFGGMRKVGKFQSRTSSQVHQRWEPKRQQKKVGGHKECSITSVFGPLSSSLSQGSKCGGWKMFMLEALTGRDKKDRRRLLSLCSCPYTTCLSFGFPINKIHSLPDPAPKILVSKNHSPLKGTSIPWENGWFQD